MQPYNWEKPRKRLEALENGLKIAGQNLPLTVQFYSMMAEAWQKMERHEKSDEYFEKALQIEPENIMILNNYGYYLSLREVKLDKAERMSRITIEAEPDNPTYLDTYAWILYKARKNEEALKYIERAMQSGGDRDPDILEHYGDILYALQRNEDALIFWKRALDAGNKSEELGKKISSLR